MPSEYFVNTNNNHSSANRQFHRWTIYSMIFSALFFSAGCSTRKNSTQQPNTATADFKWLGGPQIRAILSGNTLDAIFFSSRNGNRSTLYFSPDGKLLARNRSLQSSHVGNWRTDTDSMCIKGNQGELCYRVRVDDSAVEAWIIDGKSLEKNFRGEVYRGDAQALVAQRDRRLLENWRSSASTMMLLVGALALSGAATSGEPIAGSSSDQEYLQRLNRRRAEEERVEREERERRQRPDPTPPISPFYGVGPK